MAELDVQTEPTIEEPDDPESRVRVGPAFWVKIIGLAVFDAIVLAVIPSLIEQGNVVA
ncbi:MAG: hypothetical protein HKN93_06600, partial [Acidimicrobiia bacterium]|nr:hypothetical protein [Acidimicrobiia bacterium]